MRGGEAGLAHLFIAGTAIEANREMGFAGNAQEAVGAGRHYGFLAGADVDVGGGSGDLLAAAVEEAARDFDRGWRCERQLEVQTDNVALRRVGGAHLNPLAVVLTGS